MTHVGFKPRPPKPSVKRLIRMIDQANGLTRRRATLQKKEIAAWEAVEDVLDEHYPYGVAYKGACYSVDDGEISIGWVTDDAERLEEE